MNNDVNIVLGIGNCERCSDYRQYTITVNGKHFITGWIRKYRLHCTDYYKGQIRELNEEEMIDEIKKMYYWLF